MAAPMKIGNIAIDEAISFVNSQFGNDLSNLFKAKDLYRQTLANKQELERQLSDTSTEAPGKISQALGEADKAVKKIEGLTVEQEQLNGDICNHVADALPLVKKLTTLTEQIQELERYSKYLQWVAKIEDLSSDIQSALIINSVERSVVQFSEMAEMAKNIQSSKCTNLVKFVNDTVIFWYNILKEKFSKEFDEVLKAWKWPFIVSSVAPTTAQTQNLAQVKERLGELFTNLLHLQLPDNLYNPPKPPHPFLSELPGWRPLLLPLHIMVQPLAKRFKYHFYGKRQTNDLNKPEWYLTQCITWIRDHSEFLTTKIQPLLDKAGLGAVDATIEFSRGLVMLCMEKMLADLPGLMYDDTQFCHLVDEVLVFERELKTLVGFPATQPSCLHILCYNEAFDKWINIEKKCALERMDAMMSSSTAWQSQYSSVAEVDDLKVPECGENFMTGMVTMTERYKPLPYPQHKLKFVDLQLELLEDFRLRLVQVKNAEQNRDYLDPASCYCAILNTVNYIVEVLQDWSEAPFFLQLQYYKVYVLGKEDIDSRESSPSVNSLISTLSIDESKLESLQGTLFDDVIEQFTYIRTDMLQGVIKYTVDDVQARSKPYRRDKWKTMTYQKELGLALSTSACQMFTVLKDRMEQVQTLVNKQLFPKFWQKVAQNLNKYLYNELILDNHFSDGGGLQLQFDMTRNLFPLFGQYTTKPENYFKDVKEACILLTLNKGSAMLLKGILYTALHQVREDPTIKPTDPVAALHEFEVFKMSPEDAELVLSLRMLELN